MKLTITEKDQQQAKEYCRSGECLIATMLKRRGYKEVKAFAFTVSTNKGDLSIRQGISIPGLYGKGFTKVKKSSIGKTIELVEV